MEVDPGIRTCSGPAIDGKWVEGARVVKSLVKPLAGGALQDKKKAVMRQAVRVIFFSLIWIIVCRGVFFFFYFVLAVRFPCYG